MGNRAKPTALKILHGNPGRRPLNKSEPEPVKGIPPMPEWLQAFPVAVSEWQRESELLGSMGVLSTADSGDLAMRCYLGAEIQGLALRIKADETIGYAQINNLITNYRNLGASMGLNPSCRSKMVISKPSEPNSLEAFRNRNRGK